jgi:dethiobiotin synthetase
MSGYFITGTDTGVGKTVITLAMMKLLQHLGKRTVAMKPVATGCFSDGGGLRNPDALLLQQQSSLGLPYEKINPYAFAPPASPHIVAKETGTRIDIARIVRQFQELAGLADCVLVEGIGGWEVPLTNTERLSDLARALDLPIILVVGMRLGCLSHAFLTRAAIKQKGLDCAGWVANRIDADMSYIEDNVATLEAGLNAPLLGFVPFLESLAPNRVAAFLNNQFISQDH